MKKWTVMVYMAGDNNLDADGLGDLEEMKRVGSSDFFNAVVQFDRHGGEGSTRRYEIGPKKTGKAKAIVVEELGATNTGDPKVLEDFIGWGIERYGAEHYLLVLWNHGGGFKDVDILRGNNLDEKDLKAIQERGLNRDGMERFLSIARRGLFIHPALMEMAWPKRKKVTEEFLAGRSICINESSKDFIDSQELRNAIGGAVQKAGRKIDIIGFDACLMQMLEVLCQVRDYAEYTVGSEELEPGLGWPYHLILGVLQENPSLSPEEFSKEIVKAFGNFYHGRKELWPVTQSAVKLEKLHGLCDVVGDLAGKLKRQAQIDDYVISKIMNYVQRYIDPKFDWDYADLGDFAYLCGEYMPEVKDESKMVTGALKEAVMAETHIGPKVADSKGISIYLPRSQVSLERNRDSYRGLEFTRGDARWLEFLEEVLPSRKRALEQLKGEANRQLKVMG